MVRWNVLWFLEALFEVLVAMSVNSEVFVAPNLKVTLNATSGDFQTLDCDLDFPQGIKIPYVVNWTKFDTAVGTPIFMRYGTENKIFIASEFAGRISPVDDVENEKGSINVTDLQKSDSGWYECRVTFPNRSPSSKNDGIWIYLDVQDPEVEITSSSTEYGGTEEQQKEFMSTEAQTSSTKTDIGTTSSAIGSPRDLSVHLTNEGYLLTWTPPNYGSDKLRVYVVRLFKGSSKYLVSAVETKQNNYLIKDLDEDEIYHFQVGSLSTNDNDAASDIISVHVPAYGKIRILVAGVGCILLLILLGAVVWYSRLRSRDKSSKKNEDVKKKAQDA